jgi:hypothetical protein
MSLIRESVPLNTDGAGAVTRTVRASPAILRAVDLEIGTLNAPDIVITEEPVGTTLLGLTAVNTDGRYLPVVVGQDDSGADVVGSAVSPVVLSRIQIAVTGADASSTGRIVLILER